MQFPEDFDKLQHLSPHFGQIKVIPSFWFSIFASASLALDEALQKQSAKQGPKSDCEPLVDARLIGLGGYRYSLACDQRILERKTLDERLIQITKSPLSPIHKEVLKGVVCETRENWRRVSPGNAEGSSPKRPAAAYQRKLKKQLGEFGALKKPNMEFLTLITDEVARGVRSLVLKPMDGVQFVEFYLNPDKPFFKD